MFCPKCGSQMGDYDSFCPVCGASNGAAAPTGNVAGSNAPSSLLPMNWYKFLIYFGLFAGAVLNAINGIQLLSGSIYDGAAELVYYVFEDLKTVDVLAGLAMLALAGFGIYTRMRLAGYCSNGPQMLTYLYVASAVASLLYIIGVNAALGDYSSYLEMDYSSYIVSLVTSAVMVFANKTYFQKRASMFVN